MRLKWLRCYFLKGLDLGIETSRSQEIHMGNQICPSIDFRMLIVEASQSFGWTLDYEVHQDYIVMSKSLHQTYESQLVWTYGIGQRFHSLSLAKSNQQTERYLWDCYFTYDGSILRIGTNQLGAGEYRKQMTPAGFLLFMMGILRSSDPLTKLLNLFKNRKQV